MKTAVSNFKIMTMAVLIMMFSGQALAQQVIEGVEWWKGKVDWSQYNKVRLKPLGLSDTKILKPVWEQDDPEVWSFEDGVGEDIQAMFAKFITEELERDGGYEVVDQRGEGVLQIEVEFLSITPYIKPGETSSPSGFEIETLGSGDVHMSAEFRDGASRTLVGLVEGERQIGSEYRELSVESHMANLEETFRLWGKRLRAELDEAHGK